MTMTYLCTKYGIKTNGFLKTQNYIEALTEFETAKSEFISMLTEDQFEKLVILFCLNRNVYSIECLDKFINGVEVGIKMTK